MVNYNPDVHESYIDEDDSPPSSTNVRNNVSDNSCDIGYEEESSSDHHHFDKEE